MDRSDRKFDREKKYELYFDDKAFLNIFLMSKERSYEAIFRKYLTPHQFHVQSLISVNVAVGVFVREY